MTAEQHTELHEAGEHNFEASEAGVTAQNFCAVILAALPVLKLILFIPFLGAKTKKIIQNVIDVAGQICPTAETQLVPKELTQ